jgi:cob(I)alamin adenosyltransferase
MNKIATKTGDEGTTGLLYGSRVLKSDDRIELVGQLDELSSFIGLAKFELQSFLSSSSFRLDVEICPVAYDILETLKEVQLKFIHLMGEISTEDDKKSRYTKSFPLIELSDLDKLDKIIESFEADSSLIPTDWVLYGHNRISSQLDICSKITRRVERIFWAKSVVGVKIRPVNLKYINRLSDYLYLCARFFEIKVFSENFLTRYE